MLRMIMNGIAIVWLSALSVNAAPNDTPNTTACSTTAKTAKNGQHLTTSKRNDHTRRADLVDTAVAAGQFRTLVAAVKAAGLVEVLKGNGPYTVFAPSDEAFRKLPAGTIEELLLPENRAKLAKILTYHVVPGSLAGEDVANLNGAKTVQGQRLRFHPSGNTLLINNARVVASNVNATNGIIHVIDTVLIPQ